MFRCKLLVSFVEGAAFDEHSPRKSKAANLLGAISVHGPCPCKRNSRPRNRESIIEGRASWLGSVLGQTA
jgi:hypothetical protein